MTIEQRLQEIERRLDATIITDDDKAKTRRHKKVLIKKLIDKRFSLQHELRLGKAFGPGDQIILGSNRYERMPIKDVKDLMYLDRHSALPQVDQDVKLAIRKWLALPENAVKLEEQWNAKFGRTVASSY